MAAEESGSGVVSHAALLANRVGSECSPFENYFCLSS